MPLDGFPRFFLFFLFQSFKNLFLLCCSKIYLKWNGSEEREALSGNLLKRKCLMLKNWFFVQFVLALSSVSILPRKQKRK